MRMAAYERVELPHQLGMSRERKVRLDPLLQTGKTLLLQPRRLEQGERFLEFLERRSAPEREGLLEVHGRRLGVPLPECLTAFLHELVEAAKVERVPSRSTR